MIKVGDQIKTCRFESAEIVEVLPNGSYGLKYKNAVLYYTHDELVASGVKVVSRGAND